MHFLTALLTLGMVCPHMQPPTCTTLSGTIPTPKLTQVRLQQPQRQLPTARKLSAGQQATVASTAVALGVPLLLSLQPTISSLRSPILPSTNLGHSDPSTLFRSFELIQVKFEPSVPHVHTPTLEC